MNTTIQEAVAAKIIKSSENVASIVIDKLAEIEIAKRVTAITDAIKKQEQLEKEFKKIDGKNDITTYANSIPMEAMSKGRFEDIKKQKENLDRLVKGIEFALTENSSDAYSKLAEILKKVDNAGGNKKESSGDSE